MGPLLDSARGGDADAVGVEQDLDHHGRVERRLSAPVAAIVVDDGRQVELIDHVGEEVDEVIFGEPVAQARG
jgi:hypothetical protein